MPGLGLGLGLGLGNHEVGDIFYRHFTEDGSSVIRLERQQGESGINNVVAQDNRAKKKTELDYDTRIITQFKRKRENRRGKKEKKKLTSTTELSASRENSINSSAGRSFRSSKNMPPKPRVSPRCGILK